jgi:hypothetical protein
MPDHDLNLLLAKIDADAPDVSPHLRMQLEKYINDLLENDFGLLVQILYRVDVNEKKLRMQLQENEGKDAASIIAGLLISRQLEKIRARKLSGKQNDIPEDEKW